MNMHEPGAHRPRSGESPRPPPPLRRPGTGPGLRAPGREGRDGAGRGSSGSGRGGVWRRRPPRTAPPSGLVSRAPGAMTHIRGSCQGTGHPPTSMWSLWSPSAASSPPGEEGLGPPPGLSPPKPRLCRDEQSPASCTSTLSRISLGRPSPAPRFGHTLLTVRPLAPRMSVTPSRQLSCGGAPAR